MSETKHYFEQWPEDQKIRLELAQTLFGKHMIAAYQSWLGIAGDITSKKNRPKSPTVEQSEFLVWIDKLSEEEHIQLLAFAKDILQGLMFSTLCHFDGVSGSFLEGAYRERLRISVEVSPVEETGKGNPVATIEINRELGIELHELWYEWLASLEASES